MKPQKKKKKYNQIDGDLKRNETYTLDLYIENMQKKIKIKNKKSPDLKIF
jgi:hypothetical protein